MNSPWEHRSRIDIQGRWDYDEMIQWDLGMRNWT